MSKKIIFRADGNSKIGLGHLYRLFSFLEMIKNQYDFIFLTSENSLLNSIPKQYNLKIIPQLITIDQEPEWISKEFNATEYLLITDGYQFNTNYQKNIKLKGFKLVCINDLVNGFVYADLLINHSPNLTSQNFSSATYTTFALGTKYALLRPLFLDLINKDNQIEKLESAFICFGGADPNNLTLKATKALLKFNSVTTINVVLGGAYIHKEIHNLSKDKIKIYQNLSEKNLSDIMLNSSFAIAPASTILYELCCVKMPILSGYYVDNQKNIYQGFAKNKAIFELGNISNFSVSNFKNKLDLFFNFNYNESINQQKKMFDKNIKERYITLISELC